ncbi:MAG: MATE family efflux transporter, partial [Lachnospiraceae bacterium]|nr:MATE family efflux transporter [Lachnospiraceae bacterium]
MASTRKVDMTKGSILKAVILFAIPICIGDMLQQLYNTVDTLIIGNFCSSASLAAVGTSSQPVEIFLCIFMGLGAAASILVSQSAG